MKYEPNELETVTENHDKVSKIDDDTKVHKCVLNKTFNNTMNFHNFLKIIC